MSAEVTERLKALMRRAARPIVVLDLEATGLNVASDRIVSIAMTKIFADASTRHVEVRVNPKVVMTPEVIAVHGITNEMARGYPEFDAVADHVHGFVDGCDLLGFNLLNFDVPLLWEELYRVGIPWSLEGVNVLDAGTIFKKMEERSLAAALQFYVGREHVDAHDATADVAATLEVFLAQLERYPPLSVMTLPELAVLSRYDERVDLAGKIVRGKDGRATYNIGKARGTAVEDDLGMARWMLARDFPGHTKMVLHRLIEEVESRQANLFRTEPEDEVAPPLLEDDIPF
jgi:DNA polymerase III subunit epsilon